MARDEKASTAKSKARELPESFRRNTDLVRAGKKPLKGKPNTTKKGR